MVVMPAEVSIIVPVWNGRVLLERLLASLQAQTHPIAAILVIDNGSEDGAPEVAERLGARVIRMGSNTGFSRAVNRGIRECTTAWLAIVNSDVEPAPDWLDRLMEAARPPGVWFAAGKILSASRRDTIDGTYDAICRGACAWRVGHGRPDGPEVSRQIARRPSGTYVLASVLFDRSASLRSRTEVRSSTAVELSDRLIRGLERGHLRKPEAARLAGVTVGDDLHALDAADLVEQLAELLGRCAERKTTDEKFLTHEPFS